jgi:hypothetical protein
MGNNERTELTIIADCLLDMGFGSLIVEGIDPQSLLEIIQETYPHILPCI